MIVFLHGYLLDGSGSNLWTRSMVESLCRQGETVHLVCQEGQPECYPFISEALAYHPDGRRETVWQRSTPSMYSGTCILHKPLLGGRLPVYVVDHYAEFTDVRPMVAWCDEEIEVYLHQHQQVLRDILKTYPIRVMHANHAVLMSVVAQRMAESCAVPYVITPHGSAIEYAVKRDQRFYRYAEQAFRSAQRIYALSTEMVDRVTALFPDLPDLARQICLLNTGVDTSLFSRVPLHQGAKNLHRLYHDLKSQCPVADAAPIVPRLVAQMRDSACYVVDTHGLADGLLTNGGDGCDLSGVATWLQDTGYGQHKVPDVENLRALTEVDVTQTRVLIFVGRLIANKGLFTLIAALPGILSQNPHVRLVIVGHGPQRAVLEALVFALSAGDADLFCRLLHLGRCIEPHEVAAFAPVRAYFEQSQGEWEDYFLRAQRHVRADRVIFTGYLQHVELCHVLSLSDVAIFPSVLAEAGPLVFLEAIAAGCFPLGTDFAGMAAGIQAAATVLPAEVGDIMRLRSDPANTVSDIVRQTSLALQTNGAYRQSLRDWVVAEHDWDQICRRLRQDLSYLTGCSTDGCDSN